MDSRFRGNDVMVENQTSVLTSSAVESRWNDKQLSRINTGKCKEAEP